MLLLSLSMKMFINRSTGDQPDWIACQLLLEQVLMSDRNTQISDILRIPVNLALLIQMSRFLRNAMRVAGLTKMSTCRKSMI
ncbi:hypothetical protein GALL_118740 [mine drainage metagenome]|uniref:Uncharacterized protein n=1 Tax=mine drainage metagenome TaxID=410659 RepID=A0A1J5SPV0_9ZZZZ